MSDTLTAFERHLRAHSRRPRTIHVYTTIIAAFFAFHGHDGSADQMPTRTEIDAFLGRRRHDGLPRAPATRNQELATLKVFAAFAMSDLGWESDPTEKIAFVREPPRIPPVLTANELQRCFRAISIELRAEDRACNLAIVALLSQTGLRVHELVRLNLDQIDLVAAAVLRIEGKGGTLREVPLNERAAALVAGWIDERPKHAAPGETALFVSARGTRISIRAVERRIKRLREVAKLAKKATPHTFRHTFATLELLAGTDLATLAELLGHSDINTTALYLHFLDTRRREAVRKISYTVPAEILPVSPPANETTPTAAKPSVSAPPESSVSSRPIDLDEQHGLIAQSPRQEESTSAATRPTEGAFVVEGDDVAQSAMPSTEGVASSGRISWPAPPSSSRLSSSEPSSAAVAAPPRRQARRMRWFRRTSPTLQPTPPASTCCPLPTARCLTTPWRSTCPPTRWFPWTWAPT